jgi:pimeloyl-ACP methyl ester carboxylesterase/DNA-binding CsgD family transcriptional regulator
MFMSSWVERLARDEFRESLNRRTLPVQAIFSLRRSWHGSTIALHTDRGVEAVIPQTHYAKSGEVHIAYQVLGMRPLDILLVPGWVSHVEHQWEDPGHAYFLHRLAGLARLIVLDKRGTGLSDRGIASPDLEQCMDDVRVVLDTVGSKRPVLFGYSEGGTMCQVFAASYPWRTAGLITYGCWAKRLRSEDYPWAPSMEERLRFFDQVRNRWGSGVDIQVLAPSAANDPAFADWFASYLRRSASPGAALALAQMNTHIDVRPILSAIQSPTLVINRVDDRDAPVEGARYLAAHIPGARLVELPGADHLPWVGGVDEVLNAIEVFLADLRLSEPSIARLATVVCVDARDASDDVARDWRSAVERHQGELLSGEGNVLRAAFDGPVRAIRCACQVHERDVLVGRGVRIALHAGQLLCEQDVWSGPALAVAEQILRAASRNEIVVSSAVKDLVVGSGIQFAESPVSAHGRPGVFAVLAESAAMLVKGAPRRSASTGGRGVRALTRRQRTVLELIAQGRSNKEIAGLLFLSEHTVHRHLANILERLGVATRAAAVARIRSDLLQ